MTLTDDLKARILAEVEAGFAEQTEFTQAMVRFPSLRGSEDTIQDFVYRALAERGYTMDRFPCIEAEIGHHPGAGKFTPEHSKAMNVVGSWRPKAERGRSLVLNSHVDVVPTGPVDMWSSPPFEPVIKDGWMYGRGAGDMKAGHAAMIFALDAIRRTGHQPAATIHIQSVVEEESTGNGALAALLRGYTGEACLIPEPEDEKLVRANTGVLWFTVEVRGVPVHVREAGSGQNAIEAMFGVIAALRLLEDDLNERGTVLPAFAGVEHPINLNIGKIEGGDWGSSVPAWCRMQCRLALFPGISAETAAKEVEAAISGAARFDPFLANNPPRVVFNGFWSEGYVLEEGSDAEAVLARAHEAVFDRKLESFVTPGYLDNRVFALYGAMPSLCYGPVSKNIHAQDERVDLASVKRITGTMALFIAEWCGVEKG